MKLFLEDTPREKLTNILFKIVGDLGDSSWDVLLIVYCTLLGRNGSYWLAVAAERADAHDVSTVWPCDYFLAHGYLIVFGCERDRYG